MASTSPKISAEIFKDRRVQIGAAVVALLIIGAILFLTLGGGSGSGGGDTASDNPDAAAGGAAPAPTFPGATGLPPGGGPVMGGPGLSGPGGRGPSSGQRTASADTNSFTGAPPGFLVGSGAGGGSGALSSPFPGGPGGDLGGGTAAAAPAASKPAPIRPGVPAKQPRQDPFISFFRPLLAPRTPAYLFAQPLRVASYPKPPRTVGPGASPVDVLGPLPYVERRVAGILYNGTVSAILETGPSGPGAQVDVIQPGSRVPSGIAGIADLTVESIGPTEVVLRSEDNRRVEVQLTGLPAGAQPINPGGGVGDFPGGAPGGGFPGGLGGGRPGGLGGGGRPGGASID